MFLLRLFRSRPVDTPFPDGAPYLQTGESQPPEHQPAEDNPESNETLNRVKAFVMLDEEDLGYFNEDDTNHEPMVSQLREWLRQKGEWQNRKDTRIPTWLRCDQCTCFFKQPMRLPCCNSIICKSCVFGLRLRRLHSIRENHERTSAVPCPLCQETLTNAQLDAAKEGVSELLRCVQNRHDMEGAHEMEVPAKDDISLPTDEDGEDEKELETPPASNAKGNSPEQPNSKHALPSRPLPSLRTKMLARLRLAGSESKKRRDERKSEEEKKFHDDDIIPFNLSIDGSEVSVVDEASAGAEEEDATEEATKPIVFNTKWWKGMPTLVYKGKKSGEDSLADDEWSDIDEASPEDQLSTTSSPSHVSSGLIEIPNPNDSDHEDVQPSKPVAALDLRTLRSPVMDDLRGFREYHTAPTNQGQQQNLIPTDDPFSVENQFRMSSQFKDVFRAYYNQYGSRDLDAGSADTTSSDEMLHEDNAHKDRQLNLVRTSTSYYVQSIDDEIAVSEHESGSIGEEDEADVMPLRLKDVGSEMDRLDSVGSQPDNTPIQLEDVGSEPDSHDIESNVQLLDREFLDMEDTDDEFLSTVSSSDIEYRTGDQLDETYEVLEFSMTPAWSSPVVDEHENTVSQAASDDLWTDPFVTLEGEFDLTHDDNSSASADRPPNKYNPRPEEKDDELHENKNLLFKADSQPPQLQEPRNKIHNYTTPLKQLSFPTGLPTPPSTTQITTYRPPPSRQIPSRTTTTSPPSSPSPSPSLSSPPQTPTPSSRKPIQPPLPFPTHSEHLTHIGIPKPHHLTGRLFTLKEQMNDRPIYERTLELQRMGLGLGDPAFVPRALSLGSWGTTLERLEEVFKDGVREGEGWVESSLSSRAKEVLLAIRERKEEGRGRERPRWRY